MIKNKVWTEIEIKSKIASNNAWLERAILALFLKQTEDERSKDESRHENSVGFNKPDAPRMSYYARWIKSGKHLNGWHLEKARLVMLKYSKQLTKIANKEI